VDRAVEAVNKHSYVSGRLVYNAVDPHPEAVYARDIEVLIPPPGPPQKLTDLVGVCPGITGREPSEEYVGRLRDAW